MPRKHRHRYKRYSQSGRETQLKCSVCEKVYTRPATAHDKLVLDRWWKKSNEESAKRNKVWWEFQRLFTDGRKEGHGPLAWKWTGYDLISRIEKWAAKYPDDVFTSGIDDHHFSSSDVWYILHRDSPRKNWGTSVVVVTQCDGQTPIVFFMYPGHAAQMLSVVTKLCKYKRQREW